MRRAKKLFLSSLGPLVAASTLALTSAPAHAIPPWFPGPPMPNGVPMGPPGGGPPIPPPGGGPPMPPPRGPFWNILHHPKGIIFVRPLNHPSPHAPTHVFTRPPIPLGPAAPPPVPPAPVPPGPVPPAPIPRPPVAGGIGGLGLAGIIIGVAVVGTVVITGVNDWVTTGDPRQTWLDIWDGFAASNRLQQIAPGSHGVWDNVRDDFRNNFWGPGRPLGGGRPPSSVLVSPGQPAFTYNPGRGNAWGPGYYCYCPQGNGWGNCGVTYTIPRCADEDPYAGDCAAFLPGFAKNNPPYCSADPSSDTYRCLRQWCRRGFNAPTAEPRYTCTNMQHCDG